MNFIKRGVALLAVVSATSLAGCALPGQDTDGIRAAEGKVERMLVIGAEPTKQNWKMVLNNNTDGPIFKQYRWVTVQVIPDDSWTTIPITTTARVPDSVSRLRKGDLVDVYFKGVARSNFDKLDTAVVLRLVCPDEFGHRCWKDLGKKLGKSYLGGPTGEAAPDLTQPQYASTPYFDQEGHPLPERPIPDDRQ